MVIDSNKWLQQSTLIMRLTGWFLCIGLVAMLFVYPPGFLWGTHPESFPHIGPAHPESPYAALHPYLYMLGAMYLALGILLIRGARDPKANVGLFDYGILANLLHGLVMVPQAFFYPNEHAHMWADIPGALAICVILWWRHPNRMPG